MSSRARTYAAWARSGADASFPQVLAAVRALLPPPPLEVLDVGCGEGRLGRALRGYGYAVTEVSGLQLRTLRELRIAGRDPLSLAFAATGPA